MAAVGRAISQGQTRMDGPKSKIFILSAPSGSGKTSILKSALKRLPNLVLSVSYTTRPPRPGEQHGVDYFFVSREEFQSMIDQDAFIEWAEVYGQFYGTSRRFLRENLANGYSVILDIDVQGAMRLKQEDAFERVFVFIMPPSLSELEKRLRNRGTESKAELAKRLSNAAYEIGHKDHYDHILINEELEDAVRQLIDIVAQECGTASNLSIPDR
jgi:guanylate kinase